MPNCLSDIKCNNYSATDEQKLKTVNTDQSIDDNLKITTKEKITIFSPTAIQRTTNPKELTRNRRSNLIKTQSIGESSELNS